MGNKGVLVKQRFQTNIRILVAILVAAAMIFMVHPAYAADDTTQSNTLKITPVRSDVTIEPGASQVVKVVVTNLTKQDLRVTPQENDFVAGDEKGTPSLILDDGKYAPTHSLKRFMVPLEAVVIPVGESRTVEVTINVPKDAKAGGYFGAVRFVPTDAVSGGQVNLNASVASLILLTVPGDTVEKLTLTDFNVQQNNKTGNFFQTPDGISVNFRFQNEGNLQEMPFGKISVKNGDKVVYEYDFNDQDPKANVLPDSARRWDVPLKNIEKFGHYTVNATLTYGKNNQTVEVSKSFWVVPLSYIIGGIVGLVILILVIIGIVWFLKGYKKRILRNQGRGRL